MDFLDVHFPLRRLFDDVPKMRGLIGADLASQGSRSPTLHEISFHGSFGDPDRTTPVPEEDKRTFVSYLLRLFPNLNTLHFMGWQIFSEVEPSGDLQDILEEMSKEAVGLA